jgi:hypothetical protein
MEEATNEETIDEVLIEGHPFKTTFPPPKRMSPAQSGILPPPTFRLLLP